MPNWRDCLRVAGRLETRELTKSADGKNLEAPPPIRVFHLYRAVDESGVSGTGVVAIGIELPSKRCVLEWVSKRTSADSLGIYSDIKEVETVHGHDGATEIIFDTPEH